MPTRIGDPRRVEKLRRDHPVEGFDCGDEQLNKYLLRYAWQNSKQELPRPTSVLWLVPSSAFTLWRWGK